MDGIDLVARDQAVDMTDIVEALSVSASGRSIPPPSASMGWFTGSGKHHNDRRDETEIGDQKYGGNISLVEDRRQALIGITPVIPASPHGPPFVGARD